MRVEREVVGLENFGGLGVGGIVEQDRAQDGLFRVKIRGQAGFEGEVGDGGHIKEFEASGGGGQARITGRISGKTEKQWDRVCLAASDEGVTGPMAGRAGKRVWQADAARLLLRRTLR